MDHHLLDLVDQVVVDQGVGPAGNDGTANTGGGGGGGAGGTTGQEMVVLVLLLSISHLINNQRIAIILNI